jgi:hypothetical protein
LPTATAPEFAPLAVLGNATVGEAVDTDKVPAAAVTVRLSPWFEDELVVAASATGTAKAKKAAAPSAAAPSRQCVRC